MAIKWATINEDYNIFDNEIGRTLERTQKSLIKEADLIGKVKKKLESEVFDSIFARFQKSREMKKEANSDLLAALLSSLFKQVNQVKISTDLVTIHKIIESSDNIYRDIHQLTISPTWNIDSSTSETIGKITKIHTRKISEVIFEICEFISSKVPPQLRETLEWDNHITKDTICGYTKLFHLFSLIFTLEHLATLKTIPQEYQIAVSSEVEALRTHIEKCSLIHVFLKETSYYVLKDPELSSFERLDFVFRYLPEKCKSISHLMQCETSVEVLYWVDRLIYFSTVPIIKEKYESILSDKEATLEDKGNRLFDYCRELKIYLSSFFPNEADRLMKGVLSEEGKKVIVDFSLNTFNDIDKKNVRKVLFIGTECQHC